MNTSCIQSCLADIEEPVRVNFVKLYQWPHSDAEFLKEVTRRSKAKEINDYSVSKSSSLLSKSQYHESFAYRQRYLRSYVFSTRRESAAEKTKKWLKIHVLMTTTTDNKVNNVNGDRLSEEEGNKKKQTGGSPSSCGGMVDVMVKFLLSCIAKIDVYEEPNSVVLPRAK